jgi:transposase
MAFLAKNTVKGIDYWRIVESRREGARVRQVTLDYIGNTKKLSERILGGGRQLSLKSYSCGGVRALLAVASRLGVIDCLNECLGAKKRDGIDRGTSLLLAAVHRVLAPGSKRTFARWFEGTVLPFDMGIPPATMTSQHFWEQMDGISQEGLERAEDIIASQVCATWDACLERLALDYTNYYTFIATSNGRADVARRGHNKQKRDDLRQYSLAVVTSRDLGMPLFSHVYEGNTNDVKAFSEYIDILEKRMPHIDPQKITLVFDGGSVTKDNLDDLRYRYVTGFSLSSAKALYDVPKDDYETTVLASGVKVAAYRCEMKIWGIMRTCVLTLSKTLLAGQVRGLDSDVSKACCALDELEKKLQNPRSRIEKDAAHLRQRADAILKDGHVKEIVWANVADGHVTYTVDEGKKAQIAERYFGKKLIVTDHSDWATAEIIGAYREQDIVEKVFHDTKDSRHFSMQPTYHWTDQKIRVHVFICLLGLVLAVALHKELTGRGMRLSKDAMLDELTSIREGWIIETGDGSKKGGGTVKKMIEDMSPLQEKLWGIVLSL